MATVKEWTHFAESLGVELGKPFLTDSGARYVVLGDGVHVAGLYETGAVSEVAPLLLVTGAYKILEGE